MHVSHARSGKVVRVWRGAAAAALVWLSGCETASQDLADLFKFNLPSPAQAATDMFHEDPERRRRGISLIANSYFGGEPVYVEVYQKAVTDSDAMVRAAAARALALHGKGSDALLVTPLLHPAESEIVRIEAAFALQRLHDEGAIDAMIQGMKGDSDERIRAGLALGLGQYARLDVAEALAGALNDSSLTVNIRALRSLRIMTGQDFGIDAKAWRAYLTGTAEPFAGGTAYLYPTFNRQLSWLEKISPLGQPVFEEQAPARGQDWVYEGIKTEEDVGTGDQDKRQ